MGKEKSTNELQPLWADKKRYLGLPISFTKYSIDENRLYVQTGFFKTEIDEVLLYRILDVKSSRTFGQKIFGVGTVTLYCADQNQPTIELKNVKEAKKLHRFISDIVENENVKRGIAGREMVGAAGMMLGNVNAHNDFDGDGICDVHEVTSFEDFT